MEKRISYTQFQSVKAVAKACDPIIREKERIKKKIEALYQDYSAKDSEIAALEAGIVQNIGFHVSQLVKKVIEPGKPARYLPTDAVTYDEEAKQYVINVPEEGDQNDNPQPEETIEPECPTPEAEETPEDDNELPWTQD